MSECMENNVSLAVRPGLKSKAPFTPEELIQVGNLFARLVCTPGPISRDAVQEFADAAWKAAQTAPHHHNIRAFQIKAGKWAALKFIRSERSRKELEERYVRERFREPEEELHPECIVDYSTRDPLQTLILKEEAGRAMAVLRTLPEQEQKIFEAIVYEDRSMAELAETYGVSHQYIGQVYQKVAQKLRSVCSPVE